MVKGESRYFRLSPVNGESLSGFTCRYEVRNANNKVVLKDDVPFADDNMVEFAVMVHTDTLDIGVYKLHVFITDPSDGYVQVYSEDLPIS